MDIGTWKYDLREKHDSQPVEFKCEVVGSFRNPLERQLNEAWRIRNEDGVVLFYDQQVDDVLNAMDCCCILIF